MVVIQAAPIVIKSAIINYFLLLDFVLKVRTIRVNTMPKSTAELVNYLRLS